MGFFCVNCPQRDVDAEKIEYVSAIVPFYTLNRMQGLKDITISSKLIHSLEIFSSIGVSRMSS